MSTILVTGAAGFIGGHVARIAAGQGHRVLATDRTVGLTQPGTTWLPHNGEPSKPLPELPCVPDVAILLAWPVHPASYLDCPDNIAALAYTIESGRRLLALGCRRLVVAGTCAEYQPAAKAPIPETHPLAPQSLYAACKCAAHVVLAQQCGAAQANLAWARIFNPYGPGEPDSRLLPTIARHVAEGRPFPAGSGVQLRDYIYVDDVATAMVMLAESIYSGPINVCTGSPIRLADLMRLMAEVSGADASAISLGAKEDRSWDPAYLVGDPSKLHQLGLRPRLPAHGVRDYAASCRRVVC